MEKDLGGLSPSLGSPHLGRSPTLRGSRVRFRACPPCRAFPPFSAFLSPPPFSNGRGARDMPPLFPLPPSLFPG